VTFCAECGAVIYLVRRRGGKFWRHEPRSPVVGAHIAEPEYAKGEK